MKFIEAKSADTFNASDSRQSSNAHHKKPNDKCHSVFYFVWVGFELNSPLDKLYFKRFIPCHSELVSESDQLSVYIIYWKDPEINSV